MTDTEKQITATQKAAQTRREHKAREREEWRLRLEDHKRALDVCRQIRDDPAATDADRLEAIKLLLQLTNG